MAHLTPNNMPDSEEVPHTGALSRAIFIALACIGLAQILWMAWMWRYVVQLDAQPQKSLSRLALFAVAGIVIAVALLALAALFNLRDWRKQWTNYVHAITENSQGYQKRERLLEEMQTLAKVGRWEYHHATGELRWSEQIFQMLERSSATEKASPELFERILHPEDRERVFADIESAFQLALPYEHEYRIYTPNGSIKYVHELGRPLLNAKGEAAGTYGTVQDVTTLRIAEEVLRKANERLEERVEDRSLALQERENFLRLIIEHIPLFLYWKDRDSVYIGCNTNYAKVHYRDSPEDIIGKTDYDLIPSPERSAYYHALDRQVIETNQPLLHSLQKIENEDATVQWIDSSKIPMHNAQGETIGVLGYFEDVTDNVAAVEALERREEILRTVIHNAPVILFSIDKDECFTFIDGAALQALNKMPSEVLGVSITNLFVEGDLFIESARRALRGESHNALMAGHGIYFETHFAPIYGEREEVQGVIGVAVNITARTRAEQNAAEQQALLRNVLDTAPNIIFVKDDAGRITLANQATADLFGASVGEIAGKTEDDFPLLSDEDRAAGKPSGENDLLQERFLPEKRIVTPDGAVKWLHIIRRPLYNGNGRATHLLVIATDITQRKITEEALLAAKEAAEVANSAKSQLIASMSHELRTPLNAILFSFR